MAILNKQNKCTVARSRALVHKSDFTGKRRMNYKILGIKLLVLAHTLLLSVPNTYAEPKSFQSYKVKAASLYYLTNFVSWPAEAFDSPNTPLKICILGEDPFGVFLDKLVHEEIMKGRQIVVERIADIKDLHACHILFISSSMKEQLHHIFKVTRKTNVLTVGDVEGFARLGGILNLIHKGKRLNVEINMDSAGSAGLQISSKLLNIAKIVRSERKTEDD